jgi:hypothetical protein
MSYTIRNCTFAFKYSAVWNELEETDEVGVRFCNDCQREVFLCLDDDDLARNIKLNRCITILRLANNVIEEMTGEPAYPEIR